MGTHARGVQFARLSIAVGPDTAVVIGTAVREWLGSLALDTDSVACLVAAVDEAVTNVCEHAYPPATVGTVEVTLWTEAGMAHLQVLDHGCWRPPPDDQVGRGIGVMANLAQASSIRFDSRGTRVLLRHPLTVPASDPRTGVRARSTHRSTQTGHGSVDRVAESGPVVGVDAYAASEPAGQGLRVDG